MMFYPPNASVPDTLRTDEMLIRPLRASDVTLDYDAVISSRDELWLRSGGTWPREGFTLAENLADLQEHEQEHYARLAFTYTVMNPGETECLGCIYITPLAQRLERAAAIAQEHPDVDITIPPSTEIGASEAVVTFWVRQSRLADSLDQRLLQTLTSWFRTDWSFSRVTFLAKKAQQRQIRLFEQLGMTPLYTLPNAKIYLPAEQQSHE